MKRIRPYNVYWLVWTLVLTAAAAGVRVWQESTAFEGQYGFPVRGATASVVLVCVLVIAGAALGILAARQPVVTPPRAQVRGRRWDMSFFAVGDGAGVTRGLAQAGASGVQAARAVLERIS